MESLVQFVLGSSQEFSFEIIIRMYIFFAILESINYLIRSALGGVNK